MSLLSEVGQKAFNLGVPLSVHLDITYRCNERCVHCYLDHDDHGEMTTAEIKGVLDQLAEAGVFFLTFSGGEVFLRRDFFELLEHARRLLFNVKIKTNAVMIHEAEAKRIRALGVDTIQISVYSHRPEVHDAITKLPGSFKRTIEGIRLLKRTGPESHDCQRAHELEHGGPWRGAETGRRTGRELHARSHHHAENRRRHLDPRTAHSG